MSQDARETDEQSLELHHLHSLKKPPPPKKVQTDTVNHESYGNSFLGDGTGKAFSGSSICIMKKSGLHNKCYKALIKCPVSTLCSKHSRSVAEISVGDTGQSA